MSSKILYSGLADARNQALLDSVQDLRWITISGEKFAQFRRESTMSQETFAAKIGMKRAIVQRLSRPGPQRMYIDSFREMAEAMGIPVDQLKAQLAPDDAPADRPKAIISIGSDDRPPAPIPQHITDELLLRAKAEGMDLMDFLVKALKARGISTGPVIDGDLKSPTGEEWQPDSEQSPEPGRRKGRGKK